MPQDDNAPFAVQRRPPQSWFWPRLDQRRRKEAMRLNTIARGIVKDNPHLAASRFTKRVKVAAIRLWVLERALSALPEDPISAVTGEIRDSYSTVSKLADGAMKALGALDISVSGIPGGKDDTLDAVFARVDAIYRKRHGEQIEDVNPNTDAE